MASGKQRKDVYAPSVFIKNTQINPRHQKTLQWKTYYEIATLFFQNNIKPNPPLAYLIKPTSTSFHVLDSTIFKISLKMHTVPQGVKH